MFTVDRDGLIGSFNRAAEAITGIGRNEALGRPCSEVLRSSLCESDCPLRHTLATGRAVIDRSCFIVTADGGRVPISISTALLRNAAGEIVGGAETFRDLRVVEELQRAREGRFAIGDLVSRSPSMRHILELLPGVADSTCTVLVEGESGTGKELLARAIHSTGPRREGPFVAVSCAAIPETLLEAELFGVKAGAFTGARSDRAGRLARAEGGTLLLDEIGELTPAVQVKLLRFLQERSFEPLGSSRSVAADVRVIAATHRDLRAQVTAGAFREDLYYRVNVVRLELPPLRRRLEDVPLLAEHFVAAFNRRQARTVEGFSAQAMALLVAHDWPGNVRELENAVEHAFVLCRGNRIEPRHLPEQLRGRAVANHDLAAAVEATEAAAIREALRRNHNNRLAAARELGMHRATLFRKVKALGIALPSEDGRRRPSQGGGPPARGNDVARRAAAWRVRDDG